MRGYFPLIEFFPCGLPCLFRLHVLFPLFGFQVGFQVSPQPVVVYASVYEVIADWFSVDEGEELLIAVIAREPALSW